MNYPIANIDDAYDYLYYVNVGQAEHDEQKINFAKSFFTEKQLKDLNLCPDISFNDCFGCVCKRHNIE